MIDLNRHLISNGNCFLYFFKLISWVIAVLYYEIYTDGFCLFYAWQPWSKNCWLKMERIGSRSPSTQYLPRFISKQAESGCLAEFRFYNYFTMHKKAFVWQLGSLQELLSCFASFANFWSMKKPLAGLIAGIHSSIHQRKKSCPVRPIRDTLLLYSRMCSLGRWLYRETTFTSFPSCFRQSIIWVALSSNFSN